MALIEEVSHQAQAVEKYGTAGDYEKAASYCA
jgi:hypothetical protein